MEHFIVVAKEGQNTSLVKALHNNGPRHATPLRIHLNAKENEFKNLRSVSRIVHDI